MSLLDLDEIDYLDHKYWWFSNHRWAPLQFKASDYFKSITSKECNLQTSNASELKRSATSIAASLGAKIDNIDRVCMLAQLRCFGLYFSPVNFFFLYHGDYARYLLAEVSNTPWNKKHCYLIDLDNPQPSPKRFHVSPFMDLNMQYRWQITAPEQKASVCIESWDKDHLFTAIFSAQRYEINRSSIKKVFLQWPVVTATIVRQIYWQALKLFLKGIPYVPYQTSEKSPSSGDSENRSCK